MQGIYRKTDIANNATNNGDTENIDEANDRGILNEAKIIIELPTKDQEFWKNMKHMITSLMIASLLFELKHSVTSGIDQSTRATIKMHGIIIAIISNIGIEKSGFSQEFNLGAKKVLIAISIAMAIGRMLQFNIIISLVYGLIDFTTHYKTMQTFRRYNNNPSLPALIIASQLGILFSAVFNFIVNFFGFDRFLPLILALFVSFSILERFEHHRENDRENDIDIFLYLRDNLLSINKNIQETIVFIYNLFKAIFTGFFELLRDISLYLKNLFEYIVKAITNKNIKHKHKHKHKQQNDHYSMRTMLLICLSTIVVQIIVSCGDELCNFYLDRLRNDGDKNRFTIFSITKDIMKYLGIIFLLLKISIINKRISPNNEKISHNSQAMNAININTISKVAGPTFALTMVNIASRNLSFMTPFIDILYPVTVLYAFTISSMLKGGLSNYVKGPLRNHKNKLMELLSSRLPPFLLNLIIYLRLILIDMSQQPLQQVAETSNIDQIQNHDNTGNSSFGIYPDVFLLISQLALLGLLNLAYKAMKEEEDMMVAIKRD